MSDQNFQVFHTILFHKRIISWDILAQVEMNFFENCLRSHGLDAVYGNSDCAVERRNFDLDSTLKSIEFWLKIRGNWVFVFLEIREPHCFVLHDARLPDG